MARIVGGVGTTHVPSIGNAIAKGLQQEAYWKPFFDGFSTAHRWLAEAEPEVAVVFYNDHGLNFFLDKMPTFAVGAAPEYTNADEGWGLPVSGPFPGTPRFLAHHRIAGCRRIRRHDLPGDAGRSCVHDPDRAAVAGAANRPVRTIPIAINTVQHPLPSRRDAINSARRRSRHRRLRARYAVLVIGTGGLSHQLDGKRAGFINKDSTCGA